MFELMFISEDNAKKTAKEIFEKTGNKGMLYKARVNKKEIKVIFK